MALDSLFRKYVAFVDELKNEPHYVVSDASKLRLYGLYRQASHGDAPVATTDFYCIEKLRKHNAWTTCKGITRDEAKKGYIWLCERLKDPLVEKDDTPCKWRCAS